MTCGSVVYQGSLPETRDPGFLLGVSPVGRGYLGEELQSLKFQNLKEKQVFSKNIAFFCTNR